jgi:hypothetical protein
MSDPGSPRVCLNAIGGSSVGDQHQPRHVQWLAYGHRVLLLLVECSAAQSRDIYAGVYRRSTASTTRSNTAPRSTSRHGSSPGGSGSQSSGKRRRSRRFRCSNARITRPWNDPIPRGAFSLRNANVVAACAPIASGDHCRNCACLLTLEPVKIILECSRRSRQRKRSAGGLTL